MPRRKTGGGAGAMPPTPSGSAAAVSAAPPAPDDDLIFFVQVDGQLGWTMVKIARHLFGVYLLKAAAKELRLTESLSSYTLHVSANKTLTVLTQLDVTALITDELTRATPGHTGPWFLVVKTAAPAAAAPKTQPMYVVTATHPTVPGIAVVEANPRMRVGTLKHKLTARLGDPIDKYAAHLCLQWPAGREDSPPSEPLPEAATVEEVFSLKMHHDITSTLADGGEWSLILKDVIGGVFELIHYDDVDGETYRYTTTVTNSVQYGILIAGKTVSLVSAKDHKTMRVITTWTEAVECSTIPETYLQIGYATVDERLKGHDNYIHNAAEALERKVTSAVAQDEDLLDAYGPLRVLNDGYSMKIVDKETGSDYQELDGLVINTEAVFPIEVKAKMQKRHICGEKGGKKVNLISERCEKLRVALANPGRFSCPRFPDLWKVCAELKSKIIPIVGGDNFPADCEDSCDELHINYMKPTGVGGGFRSVINEAEGAAELARKRSAAFTDAA